MSSLPLRFDPISTAQYCVSGEVVVHPGATIASGVLLQADSGSRIVVRSGVCIGIGCVIHARHGVITLNEGVNLGAGVLLVGDISIGTNACIGAGATILDTAIVASTIVPSGSVRGDRSRSIEDMVAQTPTPLPVPAPMPSVSDDPWDAPVEPIAAPSTPSTTTAPNAVNLDQVPAQNTNGSSSSTEGVARDTSGQPWQACDTKPWDPTNNPPGETTCRVPMVDKTFEPFDANPWSDKPHSSPFPPFPEPPIQSTWVDPSLPKTPLSAHPQPTHPNNSTFYSPYTSPPATSTQTNSWLNDGEPSPISAHPQPTQPTGYPYDYRAHSSAPESDISETELRSSPSPETPTESSAQPPSTLTKHTPKQVYGQSYVNQMLGRMNGR